MPALAFASIGVVPPSRSPSSPPVWSRDRRIRWWFAVAIAIGMVIGFLIGRWALATSHPARAKLNLAVLPVATALAPVEATPLGPREAVQAWLAAQKAQGHLKRASVLYHPLDGSEGFDLDPEQVYRPASMLKVPLMMLWLQRAERVPGELERLLTYPSQAQDEREDPHGPGSLQPGHAYTVADLLRRMVVESRNDARYVLATALEPDALPTFYASLGVHLGTDAAGDSTVSAHDYAKVFHALFADHWLHANTEQQARTWLQHATFRAGLAAGVPAGVPIAHKFGLRLDRGPHGAIVGAELHECALVSLSSRPSLLCVMTSGRDPNELARVLAGVARLVYRDASRTGSTR
jgi:beta-lactamase class A